MSRRTRFGAIVAALTILGAAGNAAQPEPSKFSAPALYNLANSYARAGKPGLAVLNYERASLLEPNDPDIRANLRYVRQAAGLPPEPQTWFDRVAKIAGPQALSWVGLTGLLIAGAGVLAARAYAKHRTKFAVASIMGVSLVGATLCNGAALWPIVHGAVVIANNVPARVSPVPMGEPLFVLREAELVRMTARHDSFVLVRTSAGRQGWVSNANIAPVVP
jgi:hypothetical protein